MCGRQGRFPSSPSLTPSLLASRLLADPRDPSTILTFPHTQPCLSLAAELTVPLWTEARLEVQGFVLSTTTPSPGSERSALNLNQLLLLHWGREAVQLCLQGCAGSGRGRPGRSAGVRCAWQAIGWGLERTYSHLFRRNALLLSCSCAVLFSGGWEGSACYKLVILAPGLCPACSLGPPS